MHKACNIFCLTKAEVLLPPLTQSSPSPIEICPQAPCLKEVENLLVFLQQKTTEKCTHQGSQDVPLTATAGV